MLWRSALTSLTVVGLVFLVWFFIDRQEQSQIDRVSVITARNIESSIRHDLDARISALSGLARRWRPLGEAGHVQWGADAKDLLASDSAYQEIDWIDSAFRIQWFEFPQNNQSVQDFDVRLPAAAIQAVETALSTNAPVLSLSRGAEQGMDNLEIYVPIYNEGQFDGLMLAVLVVDQWLRDLLPNPLTMEHGITVSINDQAVYSQQVTMPSSIDKVRETSFSVATLNFRVELNPKESFLSLVRSGFFNVMLVSVLLLCVLTSMLMFFGITLRRRARALLVSLDHVEALFKNLPGISYRCRPYAPWPMDFVTEGCKTLCGYERDDFEQKRVLWGEIIHPEDREYVIKHIGAAVQARSPFELEYRIRTRSGEYRWMWERGIAIFGESDEDVNLEGFITDITERKSSESKIIEARSYSEAIIDATFEGVVTLGSDGRIRSFNREAQLIFGYSIDEAIGLAFQQFLPNDLHEEHQQYIEYFRRTGKLKYVFTRREAQLLRKDGSEFPAYVAVHEMEHQAQRQFVCMIRDISQERAAENQIRIQRAQLAHVDRLSLLGEMASNIAHDVNQPLTAISLFSQAGKRILDAGKLDQLPDLFDKVSLQAQRAGAVIERMQTMLRAQTSWQQSVDCNKLAREVVVLAEAEASSWNIVIELELDEQLPTISIDSVQIQQVMLNLLHNGMESMRSVACENGNTIKLKTRVLDGNTVQISVIDKGRGITDAVAENIFMPFFTTKDSGVGMGLSISQAIVMAHGGAMQFENGERSGAIFSFTLPVGKKGEAIE